MTDQDPKGLADWLARISRVARDRDRVSLETVLEAAGRRAFGPVILLAGLVILAPVIGDIPGVPTLMALLVLLSAGQILLRREAFWLPHWLLQRSVDARRLVHVTDRLQRPLRWLEAFTRPRLLALFNGLSRALIAGVCLLIALITPALEFIPFSANGAGAALTLFGLALLTRDGLLVLIAMGLSGGTLGILVYALL